MTLPAPPSEPADDERLRTALRCAALGVSTAGGGEVFDELARHLAEGLGIEFAFVAELAPDGTDRVHVITAWVDGDFQRDFTYDLAGTPCANVIGQVYRFYRENARRQFADTMLVDLGVEGYAAIPLFDSAGTALGLMAVMSRAPLRHPELTEWMLRIFSVRAANELEKVRARQAIREKTEQYQAIFHSALDGLLLFDEHGRPVEANPAFKLMHGYDADADFSAIAPERFIPADYLPVFRQFIEEVHAHGQCELKGQGLRRDGTIIDLDVRGVRIFFQGKPRLLAMVRDITETKKHEDALLKSEDRLRATVEAALDPIVSMDARGRIIEFNPAAEACFGYSREDAIGKSLGNLLVPERYRQSHHDGLERYLKEGHGPYLGRRIELSAIRADGSEFPIELAINVAEGEEGRIFIGYLRDITQQQRAERERVTLESQLRQAQKMEAIGHMSGGIAHDFNNILTTVLGYIVMAQERCAGAGDERVARYLDRAHLSGQRAQELIQQLLTFSRGQRGAPRRLALAPLVQEAVRLLGATLPSSIEFATRLNDAAPPVEADPVQMEQVLMNLCLNARDAMGGRGQLTVSVADVHVQGQVCTACRRAVDGHFVELMVSDTGPGVPADIQDRMFEPFFTTKEVGKGSGMGLATVHGIVHEHRGHIVLESSAGRGAQFRVLLPALEPVAAAGGADGPAASGTGAGGRRLAGRVLLVDDEPAVCGFMTDLLDSWGLEVDAQTDARVARELFDADPRAYDLLVTDQTMPGLTGLELAGAVLTRRPGLPVVLYTGFSEQVNEAVAREAGIAAFVTKPVDVDRLYHRLEQLLGQTAGSGK